MSSIGNIISETRKRKGLTQEELAQQAKINLRTIQRIEKSISEPRDQTLKLICDALEIDTIQLLSHRNSSTKLKIGTKIVEGLFLLAVNFVLMGIIGFLTMASNANLNSMFGGFLLSIFLPFFIVVCTKKMSAFERLLKFGFGYIIYFVLVLSKHGFATGFVTGLFPCLLISLAVLYFGNEFLRRKA